MITLCQVLSVVSGYFSVYRSFKIGENPRVLSDIEVTQFEDNAVIDIMAATVKDAITDKIALETRIYIE